MYPYLLSSDQHCHDWSAFSKTLPTGVNSRLQIILDELKRAHRELHKAGGRSAFYGGDLFHVRGRISPSVFNPTFQTIKELHDEFPIDSYAIPGNHDLEGKHADELGNAMQTLSTIERFTVDTRPVLHDDVLVVPWFQDLNDLRKILGNWATDLGKRAKLKDVVIHAPVNGVIAGLPDIGLNAQELADFGFRRVLAGHYHNHVDFGNDVYSIGATTHQTWSDPGTKAGFLLVYEDRVEFHESQAPKFIDINEENVPTDTRELMALVAGNYVRVKVEDATPAEIAEFKDELEAAGALGSIILATKKAVATRTGTTVSASKSLEASVSEYVATNVKTDHVREVQSLCAELIAQARAA